MPDLNDDLFSSFKDEGAPMHALPASEVRRRGDRMRRRNNTLATVGGVAAALVAIATPLAIVTNQADPDDGVAPVIRPTEVAWQQEIPGTVDVSLGIQGADASQDPEPQDDAVLRELTVCGETVFDAETGTVDTAGALYEVPNSDLSTSRTLALYPDASASADAFAEIQAGVDGCADAGDVAFERFPSTLEADQAFTFTKAVRPRGEDFFATTDFSVVVRVGNALLVTQTVTNGGVGSDQGLIDSELEREQASVVDVVAEMQAFSEANAVRVDTDDTVDLPALIPAEFPLLAGFPDDIEVEGQPGQEGPSRDLDLEPYNLSLEACGTSVDLGSLPDPTDTLYAGFRDPSIALLRQLMTFASEDEAQAYADGVLQVYRDCPEQGGAALKTFHVLTEDPGVGDFAETMVQRHTLDGEPGPGYQVLQLVRVGSAVLLFLANPSEGADPVTGSQVPDLVTTYLATNGPVIDAM